MQIAYAGCVSGPERVYVNDSCHGPGVELESDSALACESVCAVSVNGLFWNAMWSEHVASSGSCHGPCAETEIVCALACATGHACVASASGRAWTAMWSDRGLSLSSSASWSDHDLSAPACASARVAVTGNGLCLCPYPVPSHGNANVHYPSPSRDLVPAIWICYARVAPATRTARCLDPSQHPNHLSATGPDRATDYSASQTAISHSHLRSATVPQTRQRHRSAR